MRIRARSGWPSNLMQNMSNASRSPKFTPGYGSVRLGTEASPAGTSQMARASIPGVQPERFDVIANFLSHPRNRRIRAICEVTAGDASVPSLTEPYPGVNFGEREAFDMFGIRFDGHPDLARILMPDDWVGYPLRKDDAPARVPVTFKEDPGPR